MCTLSEFYLSRVLGREGEIRSFLQYFILLLLVLFLFIESIERIFLSASDVAANQVQLEYSTAAASLAATRNKINTNVSRRM